MAWDLLFFFFYKFIYLFIFIFGCVGSPFLFKGFLQLRQAGATLHRGARASHYRGLSCCGAQAQSLWLTGPVAPRHVGSSQTRARTCVPCIGRQILNHCATREAQFSSFLMYLFGFQWPWSVSVILSYACSNLNAWVLMGIWFISQRKCLLLEFFFNINNITMNAFGHEVFVSVIVFLRWSAFSEGCGRLAFFPRQCWITSVSDFC